MQDYFLMQPLESWSKLLKPTCSPSHLDFVVCRPHEVDFTSTDRMFNNSPVKSIISTHAMLMSLSKGIIESKPMAI